MTPKPRYQPGDRIGSRYQVHKALMGGMGEVYLCLDLEENYPYALKTFQQRYLTDAQRLRRAFEQEVVVWVALEKHPNIVRCFHLNMLDNQPFMILEWVAGEEERGTDLRSWLRRGPLDLRLALEIAMDICSGLIHAQQKQPGLVHRDLKPENILMAQRGLAKITDFGLAQIVQAAGLEVAQDRTTDASRQSFVGGKGVAGTPAYMAPEQWRGEPLNERTDIYALGCILYEMLSGSCPFRVAFTPTTPQSRQAWLRAMKSAHEQDPVMSIPTALPVALNDLLQRCMAKTELERYASLSDLLNHLSDIYKAHFYLPSPTRSEPGKFTGYDYINRAFTYLNLQRYSEALADANKAIELDSDEIEFYNNRGAIYQHLHQYDNAIVDFSLVIQIDPFARRSYNNRGSCYRELQRFDEALLDLNKAIQLDPLYAKAYYNRALTYHDLKQAKQALIDLNQAVQLEPGYILAYSRRSRIFIELKQFKEALMDLDRVIQLDPLDAEHYYDRATLHLDLKQYEQALVDLDQMILLDDENVWAYHNRGDTLVNLERYEEAIADYERVIQLDSNIEIYTDRGFAYEKLGRYDKALENYDQAIRLDPSNVTAYNNRGFIYLNLQNYEAALSNYNQAIQLDSTDARLYSDRGATYGLIKQYDDAIADFRQAIKLNPKLAHGHQNIGALLVNQDRLYEALPYLQQAVHLEIPKEKQHECALLCLKAGVKFFEKLEFTEAIICFELAAQLGEPKGAYLAEQLRALPMAEPDSRIDPVQQAFEALQQAWSTERLQWAASRLPFMLQADFIAAIEYTVAEQAPPEHRPALEKRLSWLRQLAKE